MKAPAISSITFDKPHYVKGDQIQVTVAYTPATSDLAQTATYTGATDTATGLTGTLTIGFVVAEAAGSPATGKITDDGNHAWAPGAHDAATMAWNAPA